MKLQIVFSSLVLAVGMIPNASFAQGNCSSVNTAPINTCVIAQNGQGTLYTMVYRLPLTNANSCIMTRVSGNADWQYPSYLRGYTNESNGGNQPRPYWMAKRELDGADYTVTNSPATFVCVRDIGKTAAGGLASQLDYNFGNNGNSTSFVPQHYNVSANQIAANTCASGNGITADEYATISMACGPQTILPVTFTYFNARKTSNSVTLSWQTASETNSANFEIQRSQNGSSFSTIGVVGAAGNSSSLQNYSFVDNTLLSGNVYYRLKQNDQNGVFKFSTVAVIRVESQSSQRVYPNPVAPGSSANLEIQSEAAQQASVSIYTFSGAQVSLQSIRLAAGSQTINLSKTAALPHGEYVVIVRTESGESTTHKLIVQ